MSYQEILKDCIEIANERQAQYGEASESINLAVKILNETFGIKLTPKEFCLTIVALKLSREKFNHKSDNIIDTINYLAMSENI
jgi:hypothetical protein